VPFPEFYVKIEKWFRRTKKLFRRRLQTKQNQNSNDFNHLYHQLNQFDGSWPMRDRIRTQKLCKSMNQSSPAPTLMMACNSASPFNLNRGDRSWAMAASIREGKARIAIRQDRRFEARPGQTAFPK
jgi:phosphatidylserine/phosphatidylglycerophosphate/cardiolipin synthase-like enzyme